MTYLRKISKRLKEMLVMLKVPEVNWIYPAGII